MPHQRSQVLVTQLVWQCSELFHLFSTCWSVLYYSFCTNLLSMACFGNTWRPAFGSVVCYWCC